jgi:endoglucanase
MNHERWLVVSTLAVLFLVGLGCGHDWVATQDGGDGDVVVPYEGDDPGECSDGVDNDLDGTTDCRDPGCFGAPVCPGADADADGDVPAPDSTEDGATDVPGDAPTTGEWLYTSGNHIYLPDGSVFHGRGANLHDTRSCNACTAMDPDPDEVMRRADELIDGWGANFVRLDLESYSSDDGYRVQYLGVLDDAAYLTDVKEIVAHIAAKPGVYVMLSLWEDPTFSALGWPTAETIHIWERLAAEFLDEDRVLFALCNEPQSNFDGAQDVQVWQAMNDAVAAIRAVEDARGGTHHIVAVQGTGGWSRRLDYYVTHPITAGGGENIAYEVHVYNPEADFADMWIAPAETLPVIIGEFGPVEGYMNLADCDALQVAARTAEVPHLAWTFHMRCPPNLLVDDSGGGCGVDMALDATEWGTQLETNLATAW